MYNLPYLLHISTVIIVRAILLVLKRPLEQYCRFIKAK